VRISSQRDSEAAASEHKTLLCSMNRAVGLRETAETHCEVHAPAGYGIEAALNITRSCVHTGKHSLVTTRAKSMPLAGSAGLVPGAVATARANDSESSTTERSAGLRPQGVGVRIVSPAPQPGVEVSDQFGFVSEAGQFRKRSAAKAVRSHG